MGLNGVSEEKINVFGLVHLNFPFNAGLKVTNLVSTHLSIASAGAKSCEKTIVKFVSCSILPCGEKDVTVTVSDEQLNRNIETQARRKYFIFIKAPNKRCELID